MESWESRLHGEKQWEGEDSTQGGSESGAVKDSWDQDSEEEEEVDPPPKAPQVNSIVCLFSEQY